MKKHLVAAIVLLLASLPSFASTSAPSPSSQFGLKRHHPAAPQAAPPRGQFAPAAHVPPAAAKLKYRGGRRVKPSLTNTVNQPTLGLIAGLQLPTGGEDDGDSYPVMGDFNGDGKMDVAKIVSTEGETISTVLSNGNGTFQSAQITPLYYDDTDPLFVGDVNNDGMDDILQVHPSAATVDIYLSNGDGTFTYTNSYALSNSGLVGGILTDYNNDGILDILTVDNQNSTVIAVALGNGDGTFENSTPVATVAGYAPTGGIVFADFNGDGKMDFAGLNSGQIEVYLASGSTFLPPVALATQDNAYNGNFLMAGDLNSDGKPELVAVNYEYNTVTVYMNNGAGSFATGQYSQNSGNLYMEPYGGAIGDINGDGNNDVVLSNEYGAEITVLSGNGTGALTAGAVGFDVGGYPWTPPLIADFNGDGLLDVIETDDYYTFVYLQGNGDGTFYAAPSYFPPLSSNEYVYSYNDQAVAIGDLNGDGLMDVVVGVDSNTNAPGVTVYLANADGTLQPGVNYGGSTSLENVTLADFDGDGNLDIAAVDTSNNDVQILFGNGHGIFTAGPTYSSGGGGANALVAADFNADGHPDLAVVNDNYSGSVGVLLNNGDGTFGTVSLLSVGLYVDGIAVADLRSIGTLDLVVSVQGYNSGNQAAVFLGDTNNDGGFGSANFVSTGGYYGQSVAVGDVNNDGHPDLVVSMDIGSPYDAFISVALGDGSGGFASPTALASSTLDGGYGGASPHGAHVVDFDGDGNLDILYVNNDWGSVGIMYGKGDGTFFTPVEFPGNYDSASLAVGDINGDGALDVVTGNGYVGGPSVFLNSTTAANYRLATTTLSATASAGSSAIYNLNVVGSRGYTGTVTFACSGLPAFATCSFNPASIGANGTTQSTTLTVSTGATVAAVRSTVAPASKSGTPLFLASLTGLGLAGLVVAGAGKKNRRQMTLVLGVLLLIVGFTMVGCGNSSTGTTQQGSYTFMVTATGTGNATITHTVNLVLVVQ